MPNKNTMKNWETIDLVSHHKVGMLSCLINLDMTNFLENSYNSLIKVLPIETLPTEIRECWQDWWRISEITLRDAGLRTSITWIWIGKSKLQFASLTCFSLNFIALQFRGGGLLFATQGAQLFLRLSNDNRPSFIIKDDASLGIIWWVAWASC